MDSIYLSCFSILLSFPKNLGFSCGFCKFPQSMINICKRTKNKNSILNIKNCVFSCISLADEEIPSLASLIMSLVISDYFKDQGKKKKANFYIAAL